ncbi:MAG: CBS domain-containing protein [Candidatus Omnitrophica bacterium]|nr:CBS domain-containing protein [Candidatus Omnitrophota bacterium]MDD5351769.1 CBS domain-containing protein [Candidatus Omnitrophota bacterium]MDD5550595.1 CBS domain-containing protein [Candidatus Omnitrophota bacterium]
MRVKDVMAKKVKSILPDAKVNKAWDLLSENKISGLPVIDRDKKLLGMFTEKDIIKYILPGYLDKVGPFVYQDDPKAMKNKVKELLSERKVCDVMRKEVVTIDPDVSLSEAAKIILTEKVRRIPVVDKEGKVVGIIAREDVVKAFIKGEV